MITGGIVVKRPAAQGVPPGVSLPAGPAGPIGPTGAPGANGRDGANGAPGVVQSVGGASKPALTLDDIGALAKTGDAAAATVKGSGVGAVARTLGELLRARVLMILYGVKADGAVIQGCAMSAGSATLTCAGASFTAADVGKAALVKGAAASGGVLITTIAGFISPTAVTLAATAATAVSAAEMTYGTDDTAAVRAAFTEAVRRGGAAVEAPAGIILISGTVTVDLSANAATTYAGTIVAPNLIGQGSGATQFRWIANSNASVFQVLGSGTNFGPIRLMRWAGYSIRTAIPGVGIGHTFSIAAQIKFEDVTSTELDLHWQMIDCLSLTFDRVYALYGRRGFWFYRNTFSAPNALTFLGGEIGGMNEWGLVVEQGSAVSLFGTVVEANGWSGGGLYAARGGIYLNNPGLEGGDALTMVGGYSETNGGTADVYVVSGSNGPVNVNILGWQFNRGADASSRWSTNSIRVNAGASAPVTVNIAGSAWKSFGGYVPSSARPIIAATGPVHVVGDGLFADVVEAPSRPNSSPFAAAYFNGTAAVGTITPSRSSNIASVTKNSTGDYTLTFNKAGRGTAYLPAFASDTAGSFLIFALSTTTFRFKFTNPAGTVVDPGNVSVLLWD